MIYQGNKELNLTVIDLQGVPQDLVIGVYWWVWDEEDGDKSGYEVRYYTSRRWIFLNLVYKAIKDSGWTEFDEAYKKF